jgi:hypothetical protein
MAKAHLKEWYTSAEDFYLGFEFYLEKGETETRCVSASPGGGTSL